jgi:hypothetical protein
MERRRLIIGGVVAAAVPRTLLGAVTHARAGAPARAGALWDVTRSGAVGDGRTSDTEALQRTIDACGEAGGGVVLIPPGQFVTGALFLRNHVHLQLTAGATLLASQRFEDFPPVRGRHEGIERTVYASLINGHDLERVTVSGPGLLDGRGPPWWKAAEVTMKLRDAAKLPREAESPPEAPLKWPRPRMVNFIRCRNVLVDGLTIKDSPAWNVHLVYCQDARVSGVTMRGQDARGTDNLVIDSCQRVQVRDCVLGAGADCISIKSGYNEDGRRVNIPCEDLLVTGCHLFYSYGSGIAIGSETAGGIRNVVVSDCVIDNCRIGVSVRSPRGRGGVVERIRVSNLVLDRINEMAVKVSNFFDSVRMEGRFGAHLTEGRRNLEIARSRTPPVDIGTPTFRDFEFSGLTLGRVRDVGLVEGLPERFIRAVKFQDVTALGVQSGVVCTNVTDVTISDLMVGRLEAPAVDARDVEALEVHRLKCRQRDPEVPVVWLQNVAGALVHGCEIGAVDGADAGWLREEASRGVAVVDNRAPAPGKRDATPPPGRNVDRP